MKNKENNISDLEIEAVPNTLKVIEQITNAREQIITAFKSLGVSEETVCMVFAFPKKIVTNPKVPEVIQDNGSVNTSPKSDPVPPSFSKTLAETKTIAQLKEIAKKMGLKTTGTQAVLIDRLIAAGYAG